MKELLRKISAILEQIYGWGIFLCLFIGGIMFFGYVAAFMLGGDIAIVLCDFIYNKIFKILIYGGNIVVLIGLANIYLKKQKCLTVNNTVQEET